MFDPEHIKRRIKIDLPQRMFNAIVTKYIMRSIKPLNITRPTFSETDTSCRDNVEYQAITWYTCTKQCCGVDHCISLWQYTLSCHGTVWKTSTVRGFTLWKAKWTFQWLCKIKYIKRNGIFDEDSTEPRKILLKSASDTDLWRLLRNV